MPGYIRIPTRKSFFRNNSKLFLAIRAGFFQYMLFLGLVLASPGAAGSVNRCQTGPVRPVQGDVIMHFKNRDYLTYHLDSGTLDYYSNGQLCFSKVYAAYRLSNGDTLNSLMYTSRSYSVKKVNGKLGNGKQYAITLYGKGLPALRQLFYCFDSLPYLVTELEITGKNLRSNYIAPWIGKIALNGQTPLALKVPFDNDTFISYDAQPFKPGASVTSAEVGLLFYPGKGRGIIAGSLEHADWKSAVQFDRSGPGEAGIRVWAGFTSPQLTRDTFPHGEVSGDKIRSPKMLITGFTGWRTAMNAYGGANRRADPPHIVPWAGPTPVGWNSWGVLQDKLTLDKAEKVTDFFAGEIPNFRMGRTAFIDLDAYWDKLLKGSDYSELARFANYCRSKGLEPGIYWAPFVDWGYKGGAGRRIEGSEYTYGEAWTKVGSRFHDIDGARAMDPTHPGTLQRINHFTAIFSACGFKMIKIDFLGHAAVESSRFFDPAVTTGMQAYRKGMEYLTGRLNGMFIYAAISPSLATGRYVHSRRIACDAFKTIAHTKYTLNSLTYGWWQTRLYDYIDADHVVFGNETPGANRARLLSSMITGTVILGDDYSTFGEWYVRAKDFFRNAGLLEVIRSGKAFTPMEAPPGNGAASLFYRKNGNVVYVAAFNFDDAGRALSIDPRRIGLSEKQKYDGRELFTGSTVVLRGASRFFLEKTDASLYKFTIR